MNKALQSGIVIVVDGGCHNNQIASERKAYGSMCVLVDGVKREFHYGGLDGDHATAQAFFNWGNDTNNQAELKSMLAVFGYIRELRGRSQPCPITVVSDSRLACGFAEGTMKPNKKNANMVALAPVLKAELEKLNEAAVVAVIWVDNKDIKEILGH